MLRHVAEGVVRPPFCCEYGAISIGDRTFVNVDAVMLDVAPITIGAACPATLGSPGRRSRGAPDSHLCRAAASVHCSR
jgi:hypothetical protein